MRKHYIDKDDICIGTEAEWGIDRCGEVVDCLKTDVRLYYIVHPFDTPDECVLISEDDIEPYVIN